MLICASLYHGLGMFSGRPSCIWVELLPLSILMPVNVDPYLVDWIKKYLWIEMAFDTSKDMQDNSMWPSCGAFKIGTWVTLIASDPSIQAPQPTGECQCNLQTTRHCCHSAKERYPTQGDRPMSSNKAFWYNLLSQVASIAGIAWLRYSLTDMYQP